MSGVWRPDAEPWEALLEAHIRGGKAGEYLLCIPEDKVAQQLADYLAGMGWALVPAPRLDHQCLRAEERIEWLESELSAAKERICELHSEVAELRAYAKRLQDDAPSRPVDLAAADELVEAIGDADRPPASVGDDSGQDVADLVARELGEVRERFVAFAGPHEGWAVLREEVDELWDEIKGDADRGRMREEAVQVAAMAMRFVIDVCGEDGE